MWYEGSHRVLLDERPMERCTGKERLKKFIREILSEISDIKENAEPGNIRILRKVYGLDAKSAEKFTAVKDLEGWAEYGPNITQQDYEEILPLTDEEFVREMNSAKYKNLVQQGQREHRKNK